MRRRTAHRRFDRTTPSTGHDQTGASQRCVFAVLAAVLGVAVVLMAVACIRAGVVGDLPLLMITVGPVLAVAYVYYFGFRIFYSELAFGQSQSGSAPGR